MRMIRSPAFAAAIVAIAAAMAGCGGGTSQTSGGSSQATLTYWASDQGSSIAAD